MIEFKNLRKAVEKKAELDLKESVKKCSSEEGLKQLMGFKGKSYKKNPQQKFLKFLEARKEKQLNEQLEQIKRVEEAEDFKGEFVITVDWKKSQMWGSNPKARTNFGFVGSSIGGCGYCKHSTATAEALNSHLPILKLLYAKVNKKGKKTNRDVLGYGCGYWILPSFEDGVGVSAHQSILKSVGLDMKNISSSKTTDVHLIKRGGSE